MLTMFLVVAIIVAVGTRASDGVQVKQQEVILRNLPEPQALAYYEVLRRRVRRVQILRVIAFASLALMFYSYKHRLARQAPAPAPAVETKR
jgi:hypothetical protein